MRDRFLDLFALLSLLASLLVPASIVGGPVEAQIMPQPVPPVTFTDASSSLPPFVHSGSDPVNGGDGLAGAAWFDCNNDRRLDLFLTNGRGQNNALFLNTAAGFVDISAQAGIENGGLGNGGVIAADFDNDGWQDLFLTGDGGFVGVGDSPVVLFHNQQSDACTFADVTASSLITAPITHMSAAAGDVDNDGWVDLFIGASGSFCPQGNPGCVPGNHASKLFRNLGGMTFADISGALGSPAAPNGVCDAVFLHYDNDPWIDLMVGNCNKLNPPTIPVAWPVELFQHQGLTGGMPSFQEIGGMVGLGQPGFFMGLGPADFNRDLSIDVFATNLGTFSANDPNALFLKVGPLCPTSATYTDVAPIVVQPPQEFGWGVTSQDFDNDGFTDVFFVGALPQFNIIGPGPAGGNPGTLLFNRLPNNVVFDDQTASLPASLDLANKFSSGLAAADYDNDGDVDMVIQTDTLSPTGGKPILLRNNGRDDRTYLRVRLRGTTSNRDGIGARIFVGDDLGVQMQEVYAGSGFMSMDSQWRHFGMGTASASTALAVWWPSGLAERYPNVPTNRTVLLVEGAGTPIPINCP